LSSHATDSNGSSERPEKENFMVSMTLFRKMLKRILYALISVSNSYGTYLQAAPLKLVEAIASRSMIFGSRAHSGI